jgi:LPXTG-motif cell wall-anchored protein
VPSVCRRIVVLLVVALLGVCAPLTSAALAQSGGAGDQQYSDPFGNDDSSSGSGSNGSSNSGSSGSDDSGAQPLTQAPQTSGSGSTGSSGTAGTSGTGTATSTTSPAASGTLPNTGLDARVLVFAGVVLVLVGAGLRMRNAPERF